MNYPSPCDDCAKCTRPQGCEAWRVRYRYFQKQINACARKLCERPVPQPSADCFTYDHPDDVRRYLRSHPCKTCHLEPTCDTPCDYYLHWYDARIQYARKRLHP